MKNPILKHARQAARACFRLIKKIGKRIDTSEQDPYLQALEPMLAILAAREITTKWQMMRGRAYRIRFVQSVGDISLQLTHVDGALDQLYIQVRDQIISTDIGITLENFGSCYDCLESNPEHLSIFDEPLRLLLIEMFPVTLMSGTLTLTLRRLMVRDLSPDALEQRMSVFFELLTQLLDLFEMNMSPLDRLLRTMACDQMVAERVRACRHALPIFFDRPLVSNFLRPSRRECQALFAKHFAITPVPYPDLSDCLLFRTVIQPLIHRMREMDLGVAREQSLPATPWQEKAGFCEPLMTSELVFFCAFLFPEFLEKEELAQVLTHVDWEMNDLVLHLLPQLHGPRLDQALTYLLGNPDYCSAVVTEFFLGRPEHLPVMVTALRSLPRWQSRSQLYDVLFRFAYPGLKPVLVQTLPAFLEEEAPLSVKENVVHATLSLIWKNGDIDDLPLLETCREYCYSDDTLLIHKKVVAAIAERSDVAFQGLLSAMPSTETSGAVTPAQRGADLVPAQYEPE